MVGRDLPTSLVLTLTLRGPYTRTTRTHAARKSQLFLGKILRRSIFIAIGFPLTPLSRRPYAPQCPSESRSEFADVFL